MIKAGEIVFNAPILFGPQTDTTEEMRAFISKTGDLYDKDGVSPRRRLVEFLDQILFLSDEARERPHP